MNLFYFLCKDSCMKLLTLIWINVDDISHFSSAGSSPFHGGPVGLDGGASAIPWPLILPTTTSLQLYSYNLHVMQNYFILMP